LSRRVVLLGDAQKEIENPQLPFGFGLGYE
jgi:hypothetical protein